MSGDNPANTDQFPPETKDVRAALDDLGEAAERVGASRRICNGAIDDELKTGERLAGLVGDRLGRYASEDRDHDPDFIDEATGLQTDISQWEDVVRQVQHLGADVSDNEVDSVRRLSQKALRAYVETAAAVSVFVSEFGQLSIEALLELPLDKLAELRDMGAAAETTRANAEARLGVLASMGASAANEISASFGAIIEYLGVRRAFLYTYLEATDYFKDLEPKDNPKTGMEVALNLAKVGAEFAAQALPKVVTSLPFVGIGVAIGDTVRGVRKNRQEVRRRAEELLKLATAQDARSHTDEMRKLHRHLDKDREGLLALAASVLSLRERLAELVEDA
jgi:hypothetical protein